VTAIATWAEDEPARSVDADEVDRLWADIESKAVDPVIVVLDAAGAQISAAVGDAIGTVLGYYPVGYEEAGTGSLHSVGDRGRADRDEWEPPLTAYYFGHHSEFPRWSVVPVDAGRRALAEFCQRPQEPPVSIDWAPD
jgi:hypothetical protein